MAMQSAAIRASNRSTVALESAVEELERRSEQLDNENLALRGEVRSEERRVGKECW